MKTPPSPNLFHDSDARRTGNRTRISVLLIALCSLLVPVLSASAGMLGQKVATFNLAASRFAADPIRPRIYATLTGTNAVAVIDTSTMSLVQLIPIGSEPVGLAISADGNTLYVANNGSTVSGVGVIDLNTLQTLPGLPTPEPPNEIAVGLNGWLFLSLSQFSTVPSNPELIQISTSGTVPAIYFGDTTEAPGFLVTSPDRKTLYFGNSNATPSTLESFDVSGGGGTLLQETPFDSVGESGEDLEISHSGAFLGYAVQTGQDTNQIAEIPTSNITGTNGFFNTGASPYNIGFSPDDAYAYSAPQGRKKVEVFDTSTFAETGTFAVTEDTGRLITDSSGKYLFVAGLTLNSDTNPIINVYDTGRAAAVITSSNSASVGLGAAFSYQITGTNSPTSFNATGLPAGLSVDPSTGIISGTATAIGTSQVIISASNAIGVAMANLAINVTGAGGESLTVGASGQGTVTHGLLGTTYQTQGSSVSITATPAEGYVFSGWTGGITTGSNPLNFTINTPTAIQANFTAIPSANFGNLVATFNVPATQMALDPIRPRIYATLSSSNSVAVIDTSTMKLVQLIPVGNVPQGLVISPDGNTLYVANSFSTTGTNVSVIDLNTLQALPSLTTPEPPSQIVVGAGNQLYMSMRVQTSSGNSIMQMSASGTGSVTFFYDAFDYNAALAASPDGRTLYYGNTEVSPGTLADFDISTGSATQLQVTPFNSEGGGGYEVDVSHSGNFLCYVAGGQDENQIEEIPANNLTSFNGTFNTDFPICAAFSPDDAYAYTAGGVEDPMGILVFDTTTFVETGTFRTSQYIERLITDSSGKYVIGAGLNLGVGGPTTILVYDTGRPAAIITSATSANTEITLPFSYQITSPNNPTSFNARGLPPGLAVNPSTGLISGTTTTPGSSSVIISASNAIGVAMADLQINVGNVTTPMITSTSLNADFGAPFQYQVQVSGGGLLTYSAAGLPSGLSIDSNTGLISGTLADAGNFTVDLGAVNISGSGSGTLMLDVASLLNVTSGVGGMASPGGVTYPALNSTVTLTATSSSGYLFEDWSGDYSSIANPLVFQMPVTASETANFLPWTDFVESYSGSLSGTDPNSSGFITASIDNVGDLFATVEIDGVKYPVLVTFPGGTSTPISIPRGILPGVTGTLSVILSGTLPEITGTLTDGAWTSDISAVPYLGYSKLNPSPLTGLYTVALLSSTDTQSVPAGTGYATVNVTTAGLARLTGMLGDGTAFSTSGAIGADGTLPLYTLLYKKLGALTGTIIFESPTNTGELDGTLNWFKPATKSKTFPAAFSTSLDVAGSSYTSSQALGTSGTLSFQDGNVSAPFSQSFTITPPHKITITDPNAHSVSFSVDEKNGSFSGKFVDQRKTRHYHGVVLQQQGAGAGVFDDAIGSGSVTVTFSP